MILYFGRWGDGNVWVGAVPEAVEAEVSGRAGVGGAETEHVSFVASLSVVAYSGAFLC